MLMTPPKDEAHLVADGIVRLAAVEVPQQEARRIRQSDTAAYLSRTDRAARGKAARAEVPLAAHAMLAPSDFRADPVELLERQAASRVAELVPIRYGRMLASPFAFYRGAALVMAADLAGTPNSGLRAQICGDAHVSNFGVFASPERNLVFDLNDFDETLPGPFEWDVKRLAASLEIAGRDNGFKRTDRREAVLSAVRSYRESMRAFARQTHLQVWYARMDIERVLPTILPLMAPDRARRTEQMLAKAQTRDSLQAFEKLARMVDGEPRIISDPPLVVPVTELFPEEDARELFGQLRRLLASYVRTLPSDRRHLVRQFRMVDMARKVVGVGSVGTRSWIILLQGTDHGDPLFLQAKEAQASVLEDFAGASVYANRGARVVAGQRLMQATSDIFLGWQRTRGLDGIERDFYVRQLRDWKGSVLPAEMLPGGMALYGGMCGWTLARAHARSGDRIAIASYLGKKNTFDQAIADFASAYADQNANDHAALRRAVDTGRVTAITGQ
jgi:uncharacterized protein (DUF2252 family)